LNSTQNPSKQSNPWDRISRSLRPFLAQPLETRSHRLLGSAELVILQIGVMDQLCQLLHRAVSKPEATDQGLERAMIAVLAEPDIEHVVRDSLGVGGRLVAKTNFASESMNFRMSQADPTRSISGRVRATKPCPGNPSVGAVLPARRMSWPAIPDRRLS
jgi:hypothetical protein